MGCANSTAKSVNDPVYEFGGEKINKSQILGKMQGTDANATSDFEGVKNVSNFHVACLHGHADVVKSLLKWKKNAVQELINSKDEKGSTPMHYAAKGNNLEIVKVLKENGAKIDEPNELGVTPLHWAAFSKNGIKMAEYLVDNGHNLTSKANDHPSLEMAKPDEVTDISVLRDYTPLDYAKKYGNKEIKELLVFKQAERSFDANKERGERGKAIMIDDGHQDLTKHHHHHKHKDKDDGAESPNPIR